MQITHDIREDLPRFREYLIVQIQKHVNKTNADSLVSRIDFGFYCEQSRWVAVVFDTRENAEPDGEWGGMIDDDEVLECHHWPDWGNLTENDSVSFVDIHGNTFSDCYTDCKLFCRIIGEALVATLLKAKEEELFSALSKAATCEMGVEELVGEYGWPFYEDRGKENFVTT